MRRTNPIPQHAKMVFKGEIFEVWQWEQKLFDGSTATFERIRRPNTAQAIAVVGDKILVQEQQQPDSKPFISLSGGRCDWGEDPLAAAKRELLEETGYASDEWVPFQEQNPVGKMEWTVYTFIARNCKKIQEPHLDAGEQITTKLISFDEFLALADEGIEFYERELKPILLRAQFVPQKRDELRKLLFEQ